MRLNILCDAHWESQLDKVVGRMSATRYRERFDAIDYGEGLGAITVILMCRRPELRFKRRIRFVTAERKLYIDVMFELSAMRHLDDDTRLRVVAGRLAEEIPIVLRESSIAGWEIERFESDLRAWLREWNEPI